MVAEFKVWSELVRQSAGMLHVFLPLRDRGIDGVLHRLTDGEYIAVQVKSRTSLTPAGQVHVTVPASSLVDDDALMVCALVDGPQLGELVLVATEDEFRRLASHDLVDGREYLTAAFQMHAGGDSRWAPLLVQRDHLAERLGAGGAGLAVEERAPPVDRAAEGLVGELEVVRRLADAESLALFRPFPDLETVEVLARHMVSRRFLGIQVKTSGWSSPDAEQRVYVRRASFRPHASTFVCVLGWNRIKQEFATDCLLIPSIDIEGLARPEGDWLVLQINPAAESHRRLDAYRTELRTLGARVQTLLE